MKISNKLGARFLEAAIGTIDEQVEAYEGLAEEHEEVYGLYVAYHQEWLEEQTRHEETQRQLDLRVKADDGKLKALLQVKEQLKLTLSALDGAKRANQQWANHHTNDEIDALNETIRQYKQQNYSDVAEIKRLRDLNESLLDNITELRDAGGWERRTWIDDVPTMHYTVEFEQTGNGRGDWMESHNLKGPYSTIQDAQRAIDNRPRRVRHITYRVQAKVAPAVSPKRYKVEFELSSEPGTWERSNNASGTFPTQQAAQDAIDAWGSRSLKYRVTSV